MKIKEKRKREKGKEKREEKRIFKKGKERKNTRTKWPCVANIILSVLEAKLCSWKKNI